MMLGLLGSGSAHANAPTVLFVLDGSGSMWAKVGDQPKIDIAKTVMTDMLRKLPPDVNAGLMVYGHNRKDDCNDIALVAPIGSDRATIVQALHNVSPKGKTPLTGAIQLAALQLRQTEGSASVVVVSDGKETCEGDPCKAAQAVTTTGADLRIHVVGFDVTPDETQQLNCIAKEGKGKYFAAANAEQLTVALAEVQKEVVAPSPPVTVAQTTPPPPKPTSEVLFEDHFDRDDLGESWEVLNLDPNRFTLSDGKLLIVGSNEKSNLALVQQPFSGNFVVTVKVDTQTTPYNWAGLLYWIDEKNLLSFGLNADCCARNPTFTKVVTGQGNSIKYEGNNEKIGDRNLRGFTNNSETWYLQLERSGIKYTARVSVDGKDWIEAGTHTLLQKNGRIGVSANSGGHIENTAEFDDFVVKGAK
ncbi:MAG: VWA domain-containing protein [Gammaproteobacteria bacterium]|nr:VWA domain-containing protein [Gammaproteobacteria bacterium]